MRPIDLICALFLMTADVWLAAPNGGYWSRVIDQAGHPA
jgi:hypothetical protein